MIDTDGRAQILYSAPNDVQFVTQAQDGTFGPAESLPSSGGGFDLDLAIDSGNGRMWAGWSQFTPDSNHVNVMVASRGADGWSQPELAIADGDLTGLAAGQGLVNVSAVVSDADNWGGLVYASSGGNFATEKLSESGGDTSSLTVDATGRPHIVFALSDPKAKRGLWYAIGPNG